MNPITKEELKTIEKGYVWCLELCEKQYTPGKIYKLIASPKALIERNKKFINDMNYINTKDDRGNNNGWHHTKFAYLGEELPPAMKVLYEEC